MANPSRCRYLFLGGFLYEYFKGKGKNRATKEDIGQLTKIVEEIKTDLADKTEQLKAQLSLVNTHKLNLKNAERNALFDYNKKLSAWLYFIGRFSLVYEYENFDGLDDVPKELGRLHYDTNIAEAQLFLFMRDKAFGELKRDLNISIIEYEGFVEKVILKAKYQYKTTQMKLASAKQEDQIPIKQEYMQQIKQLSASLRDEGGPLFINASIFVQR